MPLYKCTLCKQDIPVPNGIIVPDDYKGMCFEETVYGRQKDACIVAIEHSPIKHDPDICVHSLRGQTGPSTSEKRAKRAAAEAQEKAADLQRQLDEMKAGQQGVAVQPLGEVSPAVDAPIESQTGHPSPGVPQQDDTQPVEEPSKPKTMQELEEDLKQADGGS